MEAIFFPNPPSRSYQVEVCAHRHGKKMTYTDQTDGQHTEISYVPYMTMAKERNIKVGCFLMLNAPVDDTVGMKSDYDNGNIWFDVYSYAPNISQKISSGDITQEEWIEAYNTYLFPNFYNFLNKKPIALSYSYGNHTFEDYVTQFLAARHSGYNNLTNYGIGFGTPSNIPYSFDNYKACPSTMRWYDQAKTEGKFEEQLAIISLKIDETMQNGGWINNFSHWHNYYSDGNEQWAEAYLDLLASKNINNDIYFAGYGEAIAYLVYRQLITKSIMYSPKGQENNKLIIVLEAKNILNIDSELLQIPISIKFSTANTPLQGQSIYSKKNLISLGNDEYIIEIPWSRFPIAVIEKLI